MNTQVSYCKKVLVVLMAVMIVFTMMPSMAWADGTAGWDGTAKTAPAQENGVYQIGTAEELAWFAAAVNDGTAATQNAILTADIDLNNQEWTPIGNDDNPYEGVFDGAYHSIRNLSITKGQMYAALFGYEDSGEIKNLTVDGSIAINGYTVTDEDESYVYAAGIVGWACGNVVNCINNVNITLTGVELESGAAMIGGICGNLGTIRAGASVVGCVNNGNISCEVNPNSSQYGTVDAAGIVGLQFALSKVEACYNSGTVNVQLTGFGKASYGGISNVEGADSVNLNNCYSTGTISGSVKTGIGSYTLSGGALAGRFGGKVYPTNCAYLDTAYSVGMSNTSGQAITDAVSGISAKTADELKSADFLAALNTAAPITDYAVTWVTGIDGYPTIGTKQADTVWDGTTQTEPKQENGVYQIGTAEELAWFAAAVNNGTASDANAILTADIDLNNREWTPIGNDDGNFEVWYEGTFDGANHIIHNLSIEKGGMYAALFGYQEGGEIRNLTVDGIVKVDQYTEIDGENYIYAAGIVGWTYGNVINCTNNVNIVVASAKPTSGYGYAYIGGICGALGAMKVGATAVGCVNNGNISCEVDPNSSQYGTVEVAGIVGSQFARSKVESCYNSGTVNVYLTGFGKASYGGISNVAGADSVNLNNCYSMGTISGSVKTGIGSYTLSGGAVVGGFGGKVYPTNCAYLDTAYSVGMSNTSGQAITDAVSGISAKTADELKSADFLAVLNTAAPITDYAVTWIAGTDGYPTIGKTEMAVGIKSFTVAGIQAVIDQAAHTITAELPTGTDITKLKPTIVCFGNATSNPESGEEQDFTNPVNYTVSGITYTVTLTVAEPDFEGEGTRENPYKIDSAKRLQKLSVEYNQDPQKWAGKYWEQTDVIDMDGMTFAPIGVDTAFSGTYDGQGYEIKNLKIASGADYVGLFGVIGNTATICNVTLDSSCTITAGAARCNVGGIAGMMNTSGVNTIQGCTNHATVTGAAPNSQSAEISNVGGIVGSIQRSKNNIVIACKNYGSVTQKTKAAYYAGGIAGDLGTGAVIAACENHGEVLANSAETWSGLGNGSFGGGIAATSSGYISGCYNDGNVSAGMYVGGIAGKNQSKAVIESCYNAGTVSGIAAEANCALGGIAGDSTAATLNKCYNVGTCTPHADSNSTKLGLLVGVCKNPAELNGNYFLGSKQAEGYGEFTNNAEPAEAMMKAVDAAWLKSDVAVTALNNYPEPYSLYQATWKQTDSYPAFEKVEKILSHYAKMEAFSVTIDGTVYTGTISGTQISIVLPAGTTEITPNITISEKASVSPASGTTVTLQDGSASFTVTAENGKEITYTLQALIPAEADGLAALQVYLSRTEVLLAASDFEQGTLNYTASISDKKIVDGLATNTELYFKAIPATAGATMTVSLNGGAEKTLNAVANMDVNKNSGWIRLWSYEDASDRPIKIGENTITIKVTTGSEEKVYTLKLTVLPTLAELSVTAGNEVLSFDKTFDGNVTAYTLEIPDTVTSLKLTAKENLTDKATVTLPEGTAANGTLDITNLDRFTVTVGANGVNTDYVVTLKKQDTYRAQFNTTPAGAALIVTDEQGKTVTPNADGTYSLVTSASYTVTAGKPGYKTYEQTITAEDFANGKLTITLSKGGAALTDLTGDWTSFRNSDANMGITNSQTPIDGNYTKELWAIKFGTGSYAGSVTQPLLVDGYLYVQSGRNLLKLNPENGEVLQSASVSGSSAGFTTNPLTYGGGMIFALLEDSEGSYIQAFNAKTLASLWTSEKVSGQLISPVTYHNGYLYGGTWNGEKEIGTYYMLSATDEDTAKTNETKKLLWKLDHQGGFYWAGAYATDKFVVFGSDDGSAEGQNVSSAVLYSVNPLNGSVISKITGLKGDIRSSIAYADGAVYFTTKGGMLYQVKVDADGKLSDVQSFDMGSDKGYMSTGTPVVYDGIAFVSCSGASQFDSDGKVFAVRTSDMTQIDEAATPGYIQSSMLLTTAYKDSDHALYLYATCNQKPGGILAVKYDLTDAKLSTEEIYTPDGDKAEYNICSPICDADGNIYFKNDSTYLFAIGKRAADEKQIASVNFVLNGGSAAGISESSPKIYYSSDAGKTLPIPSKSGYTFLGWFSEDNNTSETSKQYTQVSENLPGTLYALWQEVQKPSGDDKITVTFRLIGADQAAQPVDLSKNTYLPNYVTWISTKTYTVPAGTTVGEVFKKALDGAGIEYHGYERNYINEIKAPASLGGYWLGEFDNGKKSGWMYTVRGSHPNKGLVEWVLNDGDNIVWHYVNDYSYEVEDWFDDPDYPSLAKKDNITKYYNGWLKAPDVVGSTGGGVAAGEVEEVKDVTTDTKTGTTTAPTEVKVSEKTAADGTKEKVAEVKVKADDQKEILKQAKDNKVNEIILVVSKNDVKDATKAELTLDKSFLESIVKDTNAKLTIKTPFGDKTYTQDELKALIAGASGTTITLTIEKSDELDEAAKLEKAKELTASLSLTARSAKTAKKNVKVSLKMTKASAASIKELQDMGYTVKYKFYRSTKKASKYAAKITKSSKTYINTTGAKGSKYYYKARVLVYDQEGKLVTYSKLTQCKYASRTWSKVK